MSDLSTRLALPFLAPAQAQKHVTHNEALTRLDVLVQLAIAAFEATDPPALPAPGAVYALADNPNGAWAGQDGRLAAWIDNTWMFLDASEGWQASDLQTGQIRVYSGGIWVLAAGGTENLPGVGINATSDTTNRLSVSAPATLLTERRVREPCCRKLSTIATMSSA